MWDTLRFANVLLFLAFYALGNNAIAADWEDKCEKVKRNYLTEKELYITFSPLPKKIVHTKYYVLQWNKIRVPIPIEQYKDIFVSQYKPGKYELLLLTNTSTIHLLFHKNELMHDAFSKSEVWSRKVFSTQAGVKATNEVFGGPLRLSSLTILGFNTTPAKLNCKTKNRKLESGKLIALVLKGIARPDQLISVHRWKGPNQGWLSKSVTRKNLVYSAWLVRKKSPNIIHQIIYKVPINLTRLSLIYAVDNTNRKFRHASPKWLKLLNTALQSKDKSDWNKYITHVKQTTLSRRSIKHTVENLKLIK